MRVKCENCNGVGYFKHLAPDGEGGFAGMHEINDSFPFICEVCDGKGYIGEASEATKTLTSLLMLGQMFHDNRK